MRYFDNDMIFCCLQFSEDVEWLIQLPYTMSIPYYDALIVHAGLEPGVSLDKQKPTDMCILRTLPVKNTDGSAAGGYDCSPVHSNCCILYAT